MSATGNEQLAAARAAAFAQARDIVEQWRASGRRTTTAGVTSSLKQAGHLDIGALGIASNREFWDQVDAAGVLQVIRQPNLHWLLLLPGESTNDFVSDNPPRPLPVASSSQIDPRLKTDVWTSFVDWNPAFRRFWDAHNARAFMVPTAPGWGPEDLDTTRFTEIQPAGQRQQIDWMRDFAETLPSTDRDALRAALADGAPRGAFRRELRDRGLADAWRRRLRERILAEAISWAESSNVDIATIVDNKVRDSASSRATATDGRALQEPPPTAGSSDRPAESGAPAPEQSPDVDRQPQDVSPDVLTARDGAVDGLTVLRAEMHRVIDLMAWEELAELPIRARYLLRDR